MRRAAVALPAAMVIARARESAAINIGFACIYAITVTRVTIAISLPMISDSAANFVTTHTDNEAPDTTDRTLTYL
jgi:hypothetical protein